MKKLLLVLSSFAGLMLIASCSKSGPALSVSDVQVVAPAPGRKGGGAPNPDNEGFYPLLRAHLQQLLRTCREEGSLKAEKSSLLAEMICLEVDAYQERISQLAGEIDPFRVTAITRVLPLLSQADAAIRDLRQLISWVEEGNFEAVFRLPVPRAHDVLDQKERPRFEQAVCDAEELAPLAALQTGLRDNPLPVPQLAGKITRLLAIGRQLVLTGRRQTDLDLITAAHLVQRFDHGGELRLPLDAELAELVKSWLIAPQAEDGLAAWLLEGLEVSQGELVLRSPDLGLAARVWRHDLPTMAELVALTTRRDDAAAKAATETEAEEDTEDDAEDDEDGDKDYSVAAIKKLVLNNIESTSIVLGFLRNPKIVGIPGLVATVATRARTVRLIEVIATDRRLYTGHANQEVPLACLRSPCNVSVKTLRKFVQVKYVSKVDLRALVRNHDSVRREVAAEVERYLDSLT